MNINDLRRRLQLPTGPAVPQAQDPAPSPARSTAGSVGVASPANDAPIEDDIGAMFGDDFSPEVAAVLRRSAGRLQRPNSQRAEATKPTTGSTKIARPSVTSPVDRYMSDSVGDLLADVAELKSNAAAPNQFKAENEQLQLLLDEMRQLLSDANEAEQRMAAALREKEGELEASTGRVLELEEQLAVRPKTPDDLREWEDELEKESVKNSQARRELDTDRSQLRQDEGELENQMRQMEVQMARERAMMARQEQELKRLNAEIQRELELMQRGDATLRERLSVFQRRHAEVLGGPAPMAEAIPATQLGFAQSPVATLVSSAPTPKKNDTTGLLRKIFRSE